MCKEKCKGTPGNECKACKATENKALNALKRLINQKPEAFNKLAGFDMAKVSPSERLSELKKIFSSGNIGKNELSKIVAAEANILPTLETGRKDIVIGPKSAISEYENRAMGANAISDGTNSMLLSGVEGGQNSTNDDDQEGTDWTSILNASANVIGQVGGVLGMFFGRPQGQQEQIVIQPTVDEAALAEKRRKRTTNIIIGAVVVTAIAGTVIYFVRRNNKTK